MQKGSQNLSPFKQAWLRTNLGEKYKWVNIVEKPRPLLLSHSEGNCAVTGVLLAFTIYLFCSKLND